MDRIGKRGIRETRDRRENQRSKRRRNARLEGAVDETMNAVELMPFITSHMARILDDPESGKNTEENKNEKESCIESVPIEGNIE
jgi:hypothetical protein